MKHPIINVLYSPGTNCHNETRQALLLALSQEVKKEIRDLEDQVRLIHLADITQDKVKLDECDLLVLPGGFSFGDHLSGGKILAVELKKHASAQLENLITKKIPVLGICNGFQLMTRTGLLPDHFHLVPNDCETFQHGVAPITIKAPKESIWFDKVPSTLNLHYAHAEGKLVSSSNNYDQGCMYYAEGSNPNGSQEGVTAIISGDGLRLGMMPHPERNIFPFHQGGDQGLLIFKSAIRHLLKHQ